MRDVPQSTYPDEQELHPTVRGDADISARAIGWKHKDRHNRMSLSRRLGRIVRAGGAGGAGCLDYASTRAALVLLMGREYAESVVKLEEFWSTHGPDSRRRPSNWT